MGVWSREGNGCIHALHEHAVSHGFRAVVYVELGERGSIYPLFSRCVFVGERYEFNDYVFFLVWKLFFLSLEEYLCISPGKKGLIAYCLYCSLS